MLTNVRREAFQFFQRFWSLLFSLVYFWNQNIFIFLHIRRSQLKWFRHLTRMTPEGLLREVFQAYPTGRKLWDTPMTCYKNYISWLAWECLVISPEELELLTLSIKHISWQTHMHFLPLSFFFLIFSSCLLAFTALFMYLSVRVIPVIWFVNAPVVLLIPTISSGTP